MSFGMTFWPGIVIAIVYMRSSSSAVLLLALIAASVYYFTINGSEQHTSEPVKQAKQVIPKPLIKITEPETTIDMSRIHNESSYRNSRRSRQRHSLIADTNASNSSTRPSSQYCSPSAASTPVFTNVLLHTPEVVEPRFGPQLTKRRASMISLSDGPPTEIQLTGLIDMDFQMNPDPTELENELEPEHNEVVALNQSSEHDESSDDNDNIMTDNSEENSTLNSTYNEDILVRNKGVASVVHRDTNRLSLDSLQNLVKNTQHDANINVGLRTFNLTRH